MPFNLTITPSTVKFNKYNYLVAVRKNFNERWCTINVLTACDRFGIGLPDTTTELYDVTGPSPVIEDLVSYHALHAFATSDSKEIGEVVHEEFQPDPKYAVYGILPKTENSCQLVLIQPNSLLPPFLFGDNFYL